MLKETKRNRDLAEIVNVGHHLEQAAIEPRLRGWLADKWPERKYGKLSRWRAPDNGGSSQLIMFDIEQEEHGTLSNVAMVLHLETDDDPIFPVLSNGYGSSIELEFRTQQAVAKFSDAQVAPMIAWERDPAALGRSFYLAGYIEGLVPPTKAPMRSPFMAAELDDVRRRRLIMGGIEQMAKIHAMDWREAGLGFMLPGRSDSAPIYTHLELYAREVERRLAGRGHPILERAMDWLRSNVPDAAPIGLTWGDARIGNLLVDRDCNPLAVLDWEAAALLPGDADLGWWIFFDRRTHEGDNAIRLPGVPQRGEQIEYYEKLVGRSARDIDFWQMMAAAKFALALWVVADRMVVGGVADEGQCEFARNNYATQFMSSFLECGSADF